MKPEERTAFCEEAEAPERWFQDPERAFNDRTGAPSLRECTLEDGEAVADAQAETEEEGAAEVDGATGAREEQGEDVVAERPESESR